MAESKTLKLQDIPHFDPKNRNRQSETSTRQYSSDMSKRLQHERNDPLYLPSQDSRFFFLVFFS